MGAFIAGLIGGYGDTLIENQEREHREEMERRKARVNLLLQALPQISDPNLQAEAIALAEEMATGKASKKGQQKGGLGAILGPLLGRREPGDTGHEEKVQEFFGRPRQQMVRPPVSLPVQLAPVPGLSNTAQHDIPGVYETVKGPFDTPEQIQQRANEAEAAKIRAQEEARAPFEAAERKEQFEYSKQLEELRRKAALEGRRITGKPVVKDPRRPWLHTVTTVDGTGAVVSEEEIIPPQLHQPFQMAQARVAQKGLPMTDENILAEWNELYGAKAEVELGKPEVQRTQQELRSQQLASFETRMQNLRSQIAARGVNVQNNFARLEREKNDRLNMAREKIAARKTRIEASRSVRPDAKRRLLEQADNDYAAEEKTILDSFERQVRTLLGSTATAGGGGSRVPTPQSAYPYTEDQVRQRAREAGKDEDAAVQAARTAKLIP